MKKKLVCHITDYSNPEKGHIGIDQYIAEHLGWKPDVERAAWNPEKIAALRGLFDSNAAERGLAPLISDDIVNPTEEQLKEAFVRFLNFRDGTKLAQSIALSNSKKNVATAYDNLRHAFSLQQRKRREQYLANLFSLYVDDIMKRQPNVSRKAVVNGFRMANGVAVGGPAAIFDSIYQELLEKRQNYYEDIQEYEDVWEEVWQEHINAIKEGNYSEDPLDFKGAPQNATEYKAYLEKGFDETTKLLENWESLLPFVMKDLNKREGIKLSIKKEFLSASSIDSFGDNNIAEKWDAAEAIREGWQRNNDLESAYGSIGAQVRRILATIYEIEEVPVFETKNGIKKCVGTRARPSLDDLGSRVYRDPIQVHQYLCDFFKGVRDSKDVVNRLMNKEGKAKIAWMQPLADLITSDDKTNKIATQLFIDFKKNFQPYSIMFEDENRSHGIFRYINTRVLNKPKNLLANRYKTLMSSKGMFSAGMKIWGFTPIFAEGKEGGKVNWERLAELRKEVLKWTHEEKPEREGIFQDRDVYGIPTPALLTDRRHDTLVEVDGKQQRLTYDMKRNFLLEVFTSLGYDVTLDAIDDILNSNDIYEVRRQLEQLFNPDNEKTGILYALYGKAPRHFKTISDPNASEEDKQEALKALDSAKPTFRSLYTTVVRKEGNREIRPVQEHSEKLLDIINLHQEGKRIENRVRFQGNTMYSYVNPSYLGDRLEEIESYVNTDDHKGLLNYLKEEYLFDPFFVDNDYIATNGEEGEILNMWLAEMVKACKNTRIPLKDSVAAIFQYERDLGNDEKKFEDFTLREHGVDMLVHYYADEQQHKGYEGKGTRNINKKLSALYPVFVLGDAGVSKYIRAPRIVSSVRVDEEGNYLGEADAAKTKKIVYKFDDAAKNKVLDQFYNIYIQEQRRMDLDAAMTSDLYANGKKVTHPRGEFSILTFLNPTSQEYTSEYELPIDTKTGKPTTDRTQVKEVIRKYLENATLKSQKRADGTIIASFKQKIENVGLLKTESNQRGKSAYTLLNSVMTPENVDEKLSDFYWNTKLATAQQLQLMTIDPSFYQSTKDLQKRYKEIHAPGSKLDVCATDHNGNLYSPDGIETCVYFKDLRINTEVTNPEFLESILRNFVKPGVDVEAAIAEGIVHPKESPEEETVRKNKLIDILGNDVFKKVYEPYMTNTLTDGQGYRTLRSYRKVMGMAGKWDESMEAAYNYIMDIRERYTKKGLKIPMEHLEQISKFALVLQPIKPYMFTHEKTKVMIQKTDEKGNKLTDAAGKPILVEQERLIPVQHKYAEALIIPELLPEGSQLRDLGLWMDDREIDLVGSDKICKVGCFGQVDISNCKTSSDLVTAMDVSVSSDTVHKLSYRDYRIQTNVPEHINASQLFGTQIRKLIMANLSMDSDYSFYLGGQKVNLSDDGGKTNTACDLEGKNLLALYNSLICANIFDSYDRFEKNASDIDLVSEMLQQSTIGSMRESQDNIFSYVVNGNSKDSKGFTIPLFEGGLEHDAAALLLSTFKRIVNKQQISGGSAVQVSSFGINGYDEDGGLRFVQDNDNKKNILYAEIEMPFDKSTIIDVRNSDGSISKRAITLDYYKYCYDDGNLIPTGNALQKGTKEWKKYQSYTYKEVNGELVPCRYDDAEAKVYKPLIEEEYPDILSILAYRIPSENNYSLINCQIKRFTSKMAGGTLKVPPEGSTIAGFDFDIDKLYFMQREYHQEFRNGAYNESKFSEEDKDTIWSAIYEDYEDIESGTYDSQDEIDPETGVNYGGGYEGVTTTSLREKLKAARTKAEEEDTEVIKQTEYATYYKTHIDYISGGRHNVKHNTSLNSYYDQIGGEKITGKSKRVIFAEKAKELGISPTVNISNDDLVRTDIYDFTKTPEENVKISRSRSNNLLISLIQARLMDPETMKSRYTPGGFEDAKRAARFLRELLYGNLNGIVKNGIVNLEALRDRQSFDTDPEPNFDVTDPYTILYYNQQNQLAAKLIGIFANQNTHNAFVSCMDEFKLISGLDFCGHSNMTDLLHKDNPDTANMVNLNVAQFLAASVDAVKDPVLNFMNLNTITADSAALLARLGYNMEEIGLFLSQPAIIDVCQEAFNSNRNVKTVITEMQNKLMKYTSDNSDVELSSNELALNIINDRQSKENGEDHEKFLKENAKVQSAVLDMFSKVLKSAQDVSDFVTNTKFTASNAVGSTFGSLYAQQFRVSNYLSRFDSKGEDSISYTVVVSKTAGRAGVMSKPIDNDENLLEMSSSEYLHYVRFNPFAYEQAMFDANRKAIKLLSRYFPYETELYKSVRTRMNDLCRIGNLREEDINDIHSNLPVALLARQTASAFHGEGLHRVHDKVSGEFKKSNVTNRTYYREDFAGDLEEFFGYYPELRDLDIFKYITTHSEEIIVGEDSNTGLPIKKESWSIEMQDVGGLNEELKEAIKESWAYLVEVDDDGYFKNSDYANISRDLFMYCFYQMGFNFSPISFMHLTPTAVKDNVLVEREESLPLNTFDEGDIRWDDPNSDDVIVWSANTEGSMERFAADFDINRSMIGELQGKTYRLGDTLMSGSVTNLINTAKSHPELKFKIDRTLTQKEFDFFRYANRDIPSNIYFSKDTLNSVSQEGISYGRERTYRQFLNDILHGKNQDLSIDDFAKQFILNHLDNERWVFDTRKSAKTLRDMIKEQAERELKISDRKSITFDVSGFAVKNKRDRKTLNNFVKIKENHGTIISADWSPVILYNGSYYMADSKSGLGFNKNQSMQMTYIKVTPLGSSKTLNYDNGEKLKPSMRYMSYYGETDEDLEHAELTKKTRTRVEDQEEQGEERAINPPTSEDNGSRVSLENRDPSDITNALKDIQDAAETAPETIEEVTDKLLGLDLREQVLNEEDPLNDDTFDTVEEIMRDTLGGRVWRKCSNDLKEALVKAVFDYNKNPKYLPTKASVAEDPLPEEGKGEGFSMSTGIRDLAEEYIVNEFIKALQKHSGQTMPAEEIAALKAQVAIQSDKNIRDTVESLKNKVKRGEDGVMALNENGQPIEMC
jgi:hypothetical protein